MEESDKSDMFDLSDDLQVYVVRASARNQFFMMEQTRMRRARFSLACSLCLLLAVGMVISLGTGCKGKQVSWSSPWGKKNNGDGVPLPPAEGSAEISELGGSFELPPIDPSQLPPLETIEQKGIALADAPREAATVQVRALEPVFFGTDSAELGDDALAILDADAKWLQANPNQKVQVEGHCDNRGTTEYNYALGQRRADKVREYLASKGVHPNRLFTISYGEDRPLETGGDVAKNRRVQFLAYD